MAIQIRRGGCSFSFLLNIFRIIIIYPALWGLKNSPHNSLSENLKQKIDVYHAGDGSSDSLINDSITWAITSRWSAAEHSIILQGTF
jgi:hypothetical protein